MKVSHFSIWKVELILTRSSEYYLACLKNVACQNVLKYPNILVYIHMYIQVESFLYKIILWALRYLPVITLCMSEFCRLPKAFANSLNPDQDQHNVGLDLDLNCLRLR